MYFNYNLLEHDPSCFYSCRRAVLCIQQHCHLKEECIRFMLLKPIFHQQNMTAIPKSHIRSRVQWMIIHHFRRVLSTVQRLLSNSPEQRYNITPTQMAQLPGGSLPIIPFLVTLFEQQVILALDLALVKLTKSTQKSVTKKGTFGSVPRGTGNSS